MGTIKKSHLFILLGIATLSICINLYTFLNIKSPNTAQTKEFSLNKFDLLMADAINNGNKKAFEKAIERRILIEGDTQLFYYSLLMANKHNDWNACKIIFDNLNYETNNGTSSNGVQNFSDDSLTQGLAIYYLLRSYELGNPDTSKIELKTYFNLKRIPKSNDYLISILK